MDIRFKFKTLTIIVFCTYLFWGSFGVDSTLNPGAPRIPVHRAFILLTAFILLFNAKQVLNACGKNKLLIALFVYVLMTAAWAYNPSEALKNFVFLSSSMVIAVMTALVFNENRVSLIRWLFWLFFLMTLASITTATYFPHIGINVLDFGRPRWVGITSHPNALGVQGVVLIWLSANLLFLSSRKLEKSIIIFALISAYYVIIRADSMTSLITSIIITGYVYYCYSLGKLKLPIKLILFFAVFLGVLFTFIFYMSASELTAVTLESTGRNATLTGRSLLWSKAFESAANNLILGYGFDDLEQLTKKHHILMSHLHNGYIELLVKGGLIAGTLMTIIFIKTFFNQLKMKLTQKQDFIFLNTGFVMILIHNLAESSILRGLGALTIFMIFIIVSTNLRSGYKLDKDLSLDQ